MEQAIHLPDNFYWIVGALLMTNIGALGTLIGVIFKAGKFVAATESGIKEAKDAAVRAHIRIDSVPGARP